MKETDRSTGYTTTPSDGENMDILTPSGEHSGYYISAERILHGVRDVGFFVSGEIIFKDPDVDTGFWISGGVICGPSGSLPFLR